MTEQEIADELGISQQAVNATIQRGMTKIIEGLRERGWSEDDVSRWIESDAFALTLQEYADGMEEYAP